MTTQFEAEDLVILYNYQLVATDLITPEQRKTEGGSPELKIQLFFEAPKYNKTSREVMSPSLCRALQIFTKVKIPEAAFAELRRLGLQRNSILTMRCIPNAWSIFDKDRKPRLGIWFQLDSLLKLDGKEVNYRVIMPKTQQPKTDAFDHFESKGGTTSETIDRELNSELEQYMEG